VNTLRVVWVQRFLNWNPYLHFTSKTDVFSRVSKSDALAAIIILFLVTVVGLCISYCTSHHENAPAQPDVVCRDTFISFQSGSGLYRHQCDPGARIHVVGPGTAYCRCEPGDAGQDFVEFDAQ